MKMGMDKRELMRKNWMGFVKMKLFVEGNEKVGLQD